MCPFLLDCPICWHITVVFSCDLFISLWYQLFYLFISYFVWVLSFFLGEPGLRFVHFVCLFKKPHLGFIDLLYFCLTSFFISSHLDYFLPSVDFGFCLFFWRVCWEI